MPKKAALGLLISDTSLEAVELNTAQGKFFVKSYSWLKLKQGVVSGGRVVDEAVLSENLKLLLKNAKPSQMRGPVFFGLPQSQVFLKVFNIPGFEGKEMDEAINWHVGSLAPVLPGDSYTSYEIIGKAKENQVKILLVAAGKIAVDGYLKTFDKAGIEVAAIEPVAEARARLIDPKMLSGKTVVSLHVYRSLLAVAILTHGKLWFSSEKVISGNGREINDAVDEMVGFFNSKREGDEPDISQIIYSGDQQGVEWVKAALTGRSLPVTKAEGGMVLKKSTAVADLTAAAFAPALGLAMRGRVEQKGLVDLLPDWPTNKLKAGRLKRGLVAAVNLGAVAVWLTVGFWLFFWWQLTQNKAALSERLDQVNQLVNEQQTSQLSSWKREFDQIVKSATLIDDSRVAMSQVLSNLASLTPSGVRITAFAYEGGTKKWSIAGIADSREAVLSFDKSLEDSSFFFDHQLYFSSLESNQGVLFRVSGGSNG